MYGGAGNASYVMTAAQNLTRLTKLDFTNQFLSGTVPADVSFPWLEELVMVSNNMIVRTLRIPFRFIEVLVFITGARNQQPQSHVLSVVFPLEAKACVG